MFLSSLASWSCGLCRYVSFFLFLFLDLLAQLAYFFFFLKKKDLLANNNKCLFHLYFGGTFLI